MTYAGELFIDGLVLRVHEAIDNGEDIHAVIWDINSEAWERGVMFGGGMGTVHPKREPNPYRDQFGNALAQSRNP